MRTLVLAILLPLAACATPPEGTQMAALDGSAQPEAEKTKQVCWSEIVTGTRSRRQTVCRTERSEQNSQATQDALTDFQDRSGAAGPPPIMGGN